jgi:hypothetical protein
VPGVSKLQPIVQICPAACCCKWSFIGAQPCPFNDISSMVAFTLQWQSEEIIHMTWKAWNIYPLALHRKNCQTLL